MDRIEAETARLEARLNELSRQYADLVAAARAALLAEVDGETDPLCYIRDQLPPAPAGHRLAEVEPGRCLVCPEPAYVVIADPAGQQARVCATHWQEALLHSNGRIRAVGLAATPESAGSDTEPHGRPRTDPDPDLDSGPDDPIGGGDR
ncbi:hypothetical protein [Cryptosporangium sp. NPDC051539]|uniref:hypothetical protein n=1 Tax=Cryptosporangium sp. NPDC051539 TaxID=3363962 RepID=UPI00378902C7